MAHWEETCRVKTTARLADVAHQMPARDKATVPVGRGLLDDYARCVSERRFDRIGALAYKL